jgi:hypothetical protein
MPFFLAHASKAVLIKMFALRHDDHFRPSLTDWHSTASYASVHVPVRRDYSLRYVDHVRFFPMTLYPIVGNPLVRYDEDHSLELERDSALCAMAMIMP